MNEIDIVNQTETNIDQNQILKLLEYALETEKLKQITFSVVFVGDEKIQELNRVHRQIDRITDVITFAFEDTEEIPLPIRMLGEIYVCVPQAERQASIYGHSFLRELSFLVIHGFYHLLGYDHMTKEEEAIMFEKQELILSGFGITRETKEIRD